MLTKDQILAYRSKRQMEAVAVPEWGGEVIVAELSGKERDAFETTLVIGKGKQAREDRRNFRAKLAVRCIVDEQGERVFADSDADALGEIGVAGLQRVFDVAARLNRFSKEDVEELEGN